MAKAMTLTRREALMEVLKKTCIDPVMGKAYAEAEARLRKHPKFVELQKANDFLAKAKARLEAFEEKMEREIRDRLTDLCDELGISTPSVNTSICNDIPEFAIVHEGTSVIAKFEDYHYRLKDVRLEEPVNTTATEAQRLVAEAVDLAALCVTEVELIQLIRDTKKQIDELQPPKKAKK